MVCSIQELTDNPNSVTQGNDIPPEVAREPEAKIQDLQVNWKSRGKQKEVMDESRQSSGSEAKSLPSSPASGVPEARLVGAKGYLKHVIKGLSKHARHSSCLAGTPVNSDVPCTHNIISFLAAP